jgi:hypothetical protein
MGRVLSLCFVSLVAATMLNAKEHDTPSMLPLSPSPSSELPTPWFTGPLLTPSAAVVPIGHVNIEPYVYYGSTTARYDGSWHTVHTPTFSQLRVQVPIQVGLTQWMDIQIAPQVIYSRCQGAATTSFADFPVELDFQLLTSKPGKWYPTIKLAVKESFPTGSYQHLDSDKHETDISGSGSFATSLGIVLSKLFHFSGVHYLSTRYSFFYTYPAPVHVRGFNTYGGGFGTAGKVFPGNVFNLLAGFEYSMTRRWVLALDVACTMATKTRFHGSPGITAAGVAAQVGQMPISSLDLASGAFQAVVGGPSSTRFSLAPALEYNWNANMGIIAGAIVSVAGRNSIRLASGSAAFNYYY